MSGALSGIQAATPEMAVGDADIKQAVQDLAVWRPPKGADLSGDVIGLRATVRRLSPGHGAQVSMKSSR